jgi:hypothetical protein
MKKLILFFLIGFILVQSCGSPPNPIYVKKIDGFAKQKSNEEYYMTGDFTNPPKYEIGQWVMFLSEDIDGNREIHKTALVGKEDSIWVIETYRLTPYEEEIIQFGVMDINKVHESGDLEDFDILWVRERDGEGKLDTVVGTRLMLSMSGFRDQLHLWKIRYGVNNTGGPVEVIGGKFGQSSKVAGRIEILGVLDDIYYYYHNKVQINGIIKAEADDGRRWMQLVAQGTDAKREL